MSVLAKRSFASCFVVSVRCFSQKEDRVSEFIHRCCFQEEEHLHISAPPRAVPTPTPQTRQIPMIPADTTIPPPRHRRRPSPSAPPIRPPLPRFQRQPPLIRQLLDDRMQIAPPADEDALHLGLIPPSLRLTHPRSPCCCGWCFGVCRCCRWRLRRWVEGRGGRGGGRGSIAVIDAF